MRTVRSGRSGLVLGAVLVAALTLGWGAGASGAIKKIPAPGKALGSLVAQTSALPTSAVPAVQRLRLLTLARRARGSASANPCTSVHLMTSYRKALKSTRLRATLGKKLRAPLQRRLATLGASSMTTSRSLLRSKKTKRCGGGVAPSDLAATKVTLLKSSVNGLTVRVKLPQLQFVPQTGNGKAFTKLVAPNAGTLGAVGSPGIPVVSSVLGVPDDAGIVVKTSNVQAQTIDGVDVFPIQPEPSDATSPSVTPPPNFLGGVFAQKSFVIDGKVYGHKGLRPAKPADARLLGQVRDLNIGSLQVPTAQYDPVSGTLKVLTSVDVQVIFTGGPKTFSDQIGSPWETAQNRLAKGLINAAVVTKVKGPLVIQPCGEELLVITNPTTRTAADTFAVAKRGMGYRTSVRETGAAAGQIGTTAAQIQTFVRGRVNNRSCIRPSYVTIIGDDQLVPTFTATPGAIPSDLQYSMKNDTDELPDVAVARILGNDLAQLNAAVAKIITYETTPPTGAMLNRALVAAQFQDTDGAGQVNDGQENRTFIQFAETVRNGLAARGVAVDRIYSDDPNTTPLKFNDGTDLPASLKKPTFAWNGTGAQISAAWNEGRFLVVHRDHGWSDGWGTPLFTTADVDLLTNGANLPVVLSINCSSAAYDYDDTSFAQNALTKADGGAVGVFGDTRDSPSWHNSQIALGFVDALLPSVLSGEGPTTKQRTGDALVSGKLRLAVLAPPSGPGIAGGDGNTRAELYLWHYFGDPTMQMWGGDGNPIIFNPNIFKAVFKQFPPPKPGDPPPFLVEITFPPALAGQPFSLLRNGEVIGKAIAGDDGTVQVPALINDGAPQPAELKVALDADGAAPVQFGVDGTLTQSCPKNVVFGPPANITVTGNLSGAPAGLTIVATFQAPSTPNGTLPPETVNATTDAQGNWTATLTTFKRQYLGNTAVSSSFAGSAQLVPTVAGPCTIPVALG